MAQPPISYPLEPLMMIVMVKDGQILMMCRNDNQWLSLWTNYILLTGMIKVSGSSGQASIMDQAELEKICYIWRPTDCDWCEATYFSFTEWAQFHCDVGLLLL